MRAEAHGPDGRHIVLDVKGDDLGALVDHAERLYRLIDGPAKPARAAGFTTERATTDLPYDHRLRDRPPLETTDRQEPTR